MAYLRPTGLDEALAYAAERPRVVVAGGTDHYPARVGRDDHEDVLDISAIAGLRGVAEDGSGWRLGALTTWTDLIEAPLPPLFDGLKAAAREVGGVQIQNRGTLGGNLCNASPAADGVPALLALDAEVELADRGGLTRLPLDRFIVGNRRTVLRPDQLVTAVHVPRPEGAASASFLKLGARRYLVISIVMVAAVIVARAGAVAAARVAVGSCSEVACRLGALEAELVGRPLGGLGSLVGAGHLAPLSPIDDLRGSAAYRREAALVLVRRALDGFRP